MFKLFRALGLRHLVVVDHENRVSDDALSFLGLVCVTSLILNCEVSSCVSVLCEGGRAGDTDRKHTSELQSR